MSRLWRSFKRWWREAYEDCGCEGLCRDYGKYDRAFTVRRPYCRAWRRFWEEHGG